MNNIIKEYYTNKHNKIFEIEQKYISSNFTQPILNVSFGEINFVLILSE